MWQNAREFITQSANSTVLNDDDDKIAFSRRQITYEYTEDNTPSCLTSADT